ncbi:RIC1-domain-containing protein, partial [Flagelloscypha sp. PMI_526]
MYLLTTSSARQISTVPGLPNIPPEHALSVVPSPKKTLFCTLTRNGVAVHRVRPTTVLAFLSRTPNSVIEHGENVSVHWSPDSSRLVIATSNSYLVLITLLYDSSRSRSPDVTSPFRHAPGEGIPLQSVSMQFEGVIRVHGGLASVSPRQRELYFSTMSPPAIQRIPWPDDEEDEDEDAPGGELKAGHQMWVFNDTEFEWFIMPDVYVCKIVISRTTGVEAWVTSDGRVYFVRLDLNPLFNEEHQAEAEGSSNAEQYQESSADISSPPHVPSQTTWTGTPIHTFQTPRWVEKQRRVDPTEQLHPRREYDEPRRATEIAINGRFSVVAVGMASGGLSLSSFPVSPNKIPAVNTPASSHALEWSSDGYVLAVGWANGWGLYSVGGRCLVSIIGGPDDEGSSNRRWSDYWTGGVRSLFWAPGNYELFVLSKPALHSVEGSLFSIPFAKSATTSQHAPDNTRYAFLQMEDRALVYRGADQPDLSVINPESDVWQHIKIPPDYLEHAHPVKYSCLSSDGRLIAIAGRRGLIHYSSTSGRWKTFGDGEDADIDEEQSFSVRGGMVWFHHVLLAAVELTGRKGYQIRLYSRDLPLSAETILHVENLPSPVVILSLVDNSLLAYTTDNTLYHYLIVPTREGIMLHLCGSITFAGIIQSPGMVRCLSWMIPGAQKQLGDPVNDLAVATVLMVVGGQLILLRPRKSAENEVKYDMQIFAERIEFCWIHLRGIAALENSLWAYDGSAMRVWLNALNIENTDEQASDEDELSTVRVKESVRMELDFYPLSVLMDKGIIIGAEHETVMRSNLPFVLFRHATSSHLFLHHILQYLLSTRSLPQPRNLLSRNRIRDAVIFASHYQSLVYFAHALEMLLHQVMTDGQDDTQPSDNTLPVLVEFLDHFDCSLEVVVGCARKTEMTRWRRLFDVVGSPQALFEGSYLLVLHNLEQMESEGQSHSGDAVRLLQKAIDAKEWQLSRELMRFLHSIDESGAALREALKAVGLDSSPEELQNGNELVVNGTEEH